METVGAMNIFAAIFGIFRQRGLVAQLKEGRSLGPFALVAAAVSLVGGLLYGFAMGIGLGLETAVKDAVKVGLIIVLALLFALPLFWLAYRLLGREERFGQVAAIPLTFLTTAAIVLAVTAPVVFLLSLLAGVSLEALYIHIAIVDVALLVGLYLAGTLVYHSFTAERARLIVPNVVSFLMLAMTLVVLILFFGPFLAPHPSFSAGTDLLKDRLGIGVGDKVARAVAAAAAADHLTYRFQTTNHNGDLERDYTVTRVGDDYLVEVHLHAVPGEVAQSNKRIWVVDDTIYTDSAGGRIAQADRAVIDDLLNPALPAAAFRLPDDFTTVGWRAYESGGAFTAVGTTAARSQATLTLDAATMRLSSLVIGGADRALHAETRVLGLQQATLDRAGLLASLNQAIVLSSVDRSDASMQEYVQDKAYFVVRFPRTWRASTWDAAQHRVSFTDDCGAAVGCPGLTVATFDLAADKGPQQYAEDLATSLNRQPQFRDVIAATTTIGATDVGTVEYLQDRTVKGKIETAHHIEYIFVGGMSRYHLDFAAPEQQFEANRALFKAMTGSFNYLKLPDLSG